MRLFSTHRLDSAWLNSVTAGTRRVLVGLEVMRFFLYLLPDTTKNELLSSFKETEENKN